MSIWKDAFAYDLSDTSTATNDHEIIPVCPEQHERESQKRCNHDDWPASQCNSNRQTEENSHATDFSIAGNHKSQ
jgi:transposase-like protein